MKLIEMEEININSAIKILNSMIENETYRA